MSQGRLRSLRHSATDSKLALKARSFSKVKALQGFVRSASDYNMGPATHHPPSSLLLSSWGTGHFAPLHVPPSTLERSTTLPPGRTSQSINLIADQAVMDAAEGN